MKNLTRGPAVFTALFLYLIEFLNSQAYVAGEVLPSESQMPKEVLDLEESKIFLPLPVETVMKTNTDTVSPFITNSEPESSFEAVKSGSTQDVEDNAALITGSAISFGLRNLGNLLLLHRLMLVVDTPNVNP